MRLSTSTNLFIVRRNEKLLSRVDSVRRCYQTGYRVMDINFTDYKLHFDFLIDDNWMDSVNRLIEIKEELKIEYSQSHLPYYNVATGYFKDKDLYDKMVRRAIVGSGKLGVKWAVMHPGTADDRNCSPSVSKDRNREYFLPYIELAKANGIGIAIENMADFPGSKLIRRYGVYPEELCDLIDSFGDDSVGACWDTGHANLMRYDQPPCLRMIGKRLKALHVADNRGKGDDHVLPFYGDIQWEDIMRTLVDIGYEGDFTFEIHGQVERMPDELSDEAARHSVTVGNYLLEIAREFERQKKG